MILVLEGSCSTYTHDFFDQFSGAHGDVLNVHTGAFLACHTTPHHTAHTPHNTTQNDTPQDTHNNTTTTPHGDRERQGKKTKEVKTRRRRGRQDKTRPIEKREDGREKREETRLRCVSRLIEGTNLAIRVRR